MEEFTAQPEAGENDFTAQPEAISQEASQQNANVETTTTEQPFLTVKYNKEDKPLTKDEAIEYIQRGLNLPKTNELKSELETLRATHKELEDSELIKAAKTIASERGISLSELGKQLMENRNKQIDAERAIRDNITPEAARLLRQAEERAAQAETKAQTLEETVTQYKQQEESQTVWQQQVAEFQGKHPDVDLKKLGDDAEFSELWGTGIPLEKAYQLYTKQKDMERRLNEMTQQEEVKKTNEENAAASSGPLGAGATVEKPLTKETIEKMTPDERKRRHNEVYAYWLQNME